MYTKCGLAWIGYSMYNKWPGGLRGSSQQTLLFQVLQKSTNRSVRTGQNTKGIVASSSVVYSRRLLLYGHLRRATNENYHIWRIRVDHHQYRVLPIIAHFSWRVRPLNHDCRIWLSLVGKIIKHGYKEGQFHLTEANRNDDDHIWSILVSEGKHVTIR